MYNPRLHFHFTGIGGSGMSGLAEILLSLGFKVSGSDLKASAITKRLAELGARIKIGHMAENLESETSMVVYSSAVSCLENPEVLAAKARGIPIVRRAEVLAELMRLKFGVAVAGSHGKTTTTSFIASVLEAGGLDPTVIIGGQVKSIGTGGKLGKGQYLVAETDESDRSFLLLKPTIAVVTNIDAEHLSAYSSQADLDDSFRQFVDAVPFYGLSVLCIDDPRVRSLANQNSGRKLTYGCAPDAQLRGVDFNCHRAGTAFEVSYQGQKLGRIELPMLGRHLAINSLAAVGVGLEFGVPFNIIAQALAQFSGIKRRLEILHDAAGVVVLNDYGHHPTEIHACITAVRAAYGKEMKRLWVIFQPHRYSRTKECFVEFLTAFGEADRVWISDIYSAGEAPLPGVSSAALVDAISHPECKHIPDLDDCRELALNVMAPGDVILCLGAGSIGTFAERLVIGLDEHLARRPKYGAGELRLVNG